MQYLLYYVTCKHKPEAFILRHYDFVELLEQSELGLCDVLIPAMKMSCSYFEAARGLVQSQDRKMASTERTRDTHSPSLVLVLSGS